MKSERPSKDVRVRTTLSLRSLGGENCFAVTRRCFLRTKSEKPLPSRPSFLRRRTSTGFASRRFSRWQSENQKDSRLGRVRIIISDGTCALLNAQQIKMVSRAACVCAMCSRTGQGLHVCMRAYLRNLLGSAARCWPNPCCGTAFVHFFCSLFINLLCRKPEIKSLGFTCNWWFLSGGLLGQARLACTSESQISSRQQNEKGNALPCQILRDTQHSFGCCVGLAQVKETPALQRTEQPRRCDSDQTYDDAQVSQPHTYMHILPCLSRWQEPCTSKTSSFHNSAAGTWSFGTLVHNISVVQLKPTKKYLQRLLVPLAFATAKSALYLVGSPAHPKMLAAVANRWAETESKAPSSSGMVKANDDGACLRLAHAQVENEIPAQPRRAPRRGAREYRRLRAFAFPIWRIHIQTKSTFICGFNGVEGGGVSLRQRKDRERREDRTTDRENSGVALTEGKEDAWTPGSLQGISESGQEESCSAWKLQEGLDTKKKNSASLARFLMVQEHSQIAKPLEILNHWSNLSDQDCKFIHNTINTLSVLPRPPLFNLLFLCFALHHVTIRFSFFFFFQ